MQKWIAVVVVATAGSVALAQQAVAPPAPFADPQRRVKLATAFPDIDKILSDYARSVHAPGAAWGVVIDGELAHQGTFGVREVRSRAPVDADTVFRIASMTKSFTAMSILKLRDAGKLSLDDPAERYVPELKSLRYPTTDSPRSHDSTPAHPFGGIPGGQPLGRSTAVRERGRTVPHAALGYSVLERAGRCIRILELRVCDSRPHRVL